MFEAITLKAARALIKDKLSDFDLKFETVPLELADGRILYEDVFSRENLPSFRRSTVDGYAIRASETFGASESVCALFSLVGKVKMGEHCEATLQSGQAYYVPTGGMLPRGADAAVMQEYADLNGDELCVYKPVRVKENIVDAGEDLAEGSLVFRRGDYLNAMKIGALAALGITRIKVFSKVKLAIISTGDEIVNADDSVGLCKIRDANMPLIRASLNGLCDTVYTRIVKDEKRALENALREALAASDIVVLSGGSSVGERDYTYQCISQFANDVFVKGISLKPGKPTIVAKADGKLIFGLAGHTMAAAVTARLLIRQPLLEVMGMTDRNGVVRAKAAINFPSSAGRTTIMPVTLADNGGEYTAYPVFSKSGLISLIAKADGYTLIEDKTEGIYKGEWMEVFLL